ncbi:solute carrier family 66 member 3 isoform X2 [Plutella xylostella]|uniref:solute carrier family 66 member 3 isoform X2 n=1 Tax=Plutella xylostella TaxID=51655 RepID=UPI0005D0A2DC|nr:solute carrier family 66 member 3 isoform X2 [Plutella xylostella]
MSSKDSTEMAEAAVIDESGWLHMVANALSVLTIGSCLFLKVPQILQVQERKSARGIYIQAMLMEIFGFTIMTLYNYVNHYSILTYLEYPIILIQVYVLLYLVLKYRNLLENAVVPAAVCIYSLVVTLFAIEILPKAILTFIVPAVTLFHGVRPIRRGGRIILGRGPFSRIGEIPICTPLSGFAKVTYMYGIIQTGNAEAVSLTTWSISIATNAVRIFTVWVDSGDSNLMTNFVISTLLSTGVLVTAMIYQMKTRAKKEHLAQMRKLELLERKKAREQKCICPNEDCSCKRRLLF